MAEELELVKISELPEATNVTATDVAAIVQNGVTKKAPLPVIRKYVVDSLGSAAKASIGDFEPSGSVFEVDLKSQERADEQNKRIDRIEIAAYLLRNNKVFKAYRTKALMLADVENIPKNSLVHIAKDPANNAEINDINGQYHYDGNDFLKLPDDILSLIDTRAKQTLTEAATYADQLKVDAVHTAALDAQIKADEAEISAITAAATDASTKAATAKSEAITAAATDAESKYALLNNLLAAASKTLTLSNNNSYISTGGELKGLSGVAVYTTQCAAGELYRIKTSTTYSNALTSKVAYAFYSSTTLSTDTFISGGTALAAAQAIDLLALAPESAVILAITNYTVLNGSVSYYQRKPSDTTVENKAEIIANKTEITSLRKISGYNVLMNKSTSTINTVFNSLNDAIIDAVLISGTLPNDLRLSTFPTLSSVKAGLAFSSTSIAIRGNSLTYLPTAFAIPAGGAKIEVFFNTDVFVLKLYIDFSKMPDVTGTQVTGNTLPYYFDVERISIKEVDRLTGYYFTQKVEKMKIRSLDNAMRIPKMVHNYLNDRFYNPVFEYRDLSTTLLTIPNNSNTAEMDYNYHHVVTHITAPTFVTDAVGTLAQYSAAYGFSGQGLVSLSGLFSNGELVYGLKIDPALIRTTSLTVNNGSGDSNTYSLLNHLRGKTNNAYESTILLYADLDNGYFIFKSVYTVDSSVNKSQTQLIGVLNSSLTSGTFTVSLYNLVAAKSFNYLSDTPYSRTQDSPWVGKNLMYFGDSNSRANIAHEAIKRLGCSVYWNASGGRSMQYRGVSESESDLGWLYHWNRRSHIKNIKDSGKLLDLFLFNASYNDSSGGGTLSDTAIQAVLDNYPTLQDDADTVNAKLTIFNNLTVVQRKSIFGYRQTFAAYLLQIITMFPTAKIFLTTMLYSPAAQNGSGTTSGTVNQQRAYDKQIRDAINADIKLIAQWYGISVIDVNSNAGYYYGNMTNYTSDTIHFDEVIGKRIGYFIAKNILLQTV